MDADLFTGRLVRLGALELEEFAQANSRWERDSEFHRLSDAVPAQAFSVPQFRRFVEHELERVPQPAFFQIHTLEDGRLIGLVGLGRIYWSHGDCWVGIAIGDRADWGKGYGTDAMRVMLRYAFIELNLHRVSLGVFAYNPRAIRSYEKLGFRREGCGRQEIHRDGQWWDAVYMGLPREEWLQTIASKE